MGSAVGFLLQARLRAHPGRIWPCPVVRCSSVPRPENRGVSRSQPLVRELPPSSHFFVYDDGSGVLPLCAVQGRRVDRRRRRSRRGLSGGRFPLSLGQGTRRGRAGNGTLCCRCCHSCRNVLGMRGQATADSTRGWARTSSPRRATRQTSVDLLSSSLSLDPFTPRTAPLRRGAVSAGWLLLRLPPPPKETCSQHRDPLFRISCLLLCSLALSCCSPYTPRRSAHSLSRRMLSFSRSPLRWPASLRPPRFKPAS